MRRFVTGSAISLVVLLQVASGSLAQDASPAAGSAAQANATASAPAAAVGEPLPYVEYVAALKAFIDQDPFGEMGDPPTKEQVVAGFRNLVGMATAELARLETIVPEACYAEAHEELLGYWRSSIEVTAEAATQLEAAATVEEVMPISTAMDEILYSRHPAAYVEVEDGSGGFQGSPFNILTALAMCETGQGTSPGTGTGEGAESATATMAAQSPAP